jgi:hypothetical protein
MRHRFLPFIIAGGIFILLAPITVDTYNTLNQRAFLDLLLAGNPFSLASGQTLAFRGESWPLDWPYPPLTILFVWPAWGLFRLTRSEAVFQLAFKLPFLLTAILTQVLILKSLAVDGDVQTNGKMGRWYSVLPVVVLFTSIAGGFDVVAAWLILLAYVLYRGEHLAWSAVSIGLAGALRIYPFVLVPVFLIHIWKSAPRHTRAVMIYLMLSLAPLIVSCLPFVLNDWLGLVNTLKAGQMAFGPFATLDFVAVMAYPLWANSHFALDLQTAGIFWGGATLLALGGVYTGLSVRRAHPDSVLGDCLVTLLVFFLLYPKVHGLYLIVVLPLALIFPARIARWLWVPGVCWMVLVNGDFGASGLGYWLAPATGYWENLLPAMHRAYVTVVLAGAQMVIIAWAIIRIVRGPNKRFVQVKR